MTGTDKLGFRQMLILVFFFSTSTVFGQIVVRTVFLPQVYYVGDVVEARVTIRGINPDELAVPSSLPKLDWIEVREVGFFGTGDGIGVRIVFQPFFVGTRNLPPLDLGPFELDTVTAVVASSVQEGERQLEPMRGQLLLPGTRLVVGVTFTLVFVAPVVLYVMWGYGRRRLTALIGRYRSGLPYRKLARGLRHLESDIHEIDARRYYIRLTELARLFLARRASGKFISATTRELPGLLSDIGLTDNQIQELMEVFNAGDLAKFASRHVSLDQRRHHAETLQHIGRIIHRERRDAAGKTADPGQKTYVDS